MRIHIKTTPSVGLVSYDHLNDLHKTLQRWLGRNDLHGKLSLYCYSSLRGAKATDSGLEFSEGADFFISCWDSKYILRLIDGIRATPDMFNGMRVLDITIEENPDLTDKERFILASPILIKRQINGGEIKFYTFDDKEAESIMLETIQHKMKYAGLPNDDTLTLEFDRTYHAKKTKLVKYMKGAGNQIKMRANMCPVIIKGSNLTKQFIWNVGVGCSTGIGFGSIR